MLGIGIFYQILVNIGGVGRAFLLIIFAITYPVCAASFAQSAVFEFGPDGEVLSINQKPENDNNFQTESQSSRTVTKTTNQTKYQELTRGVATKYSGSPGVRTAGLDALTFINVFDALINRESNFNPKAISPKGAVGLGQLMPGTAADLGVKDPFDPKDNLHGSAKYFTQQLEQFGSLDLALSAYNAGPERVREFHGIPPFAETRSYIKWIRNKAGLKARIATTARSSINKNHSHNHQSTHRGNVSVWEF